MHKDDEKWVKNKINELPDVKLKLLAWKCYKEKYKSAFDLQSIGFKKENSARRAANNALRIYVDRVNKAGHTTNQ